MISDIISCLQKLCTVKNITGNRRLYSNSLKDDFAGYGCYGWVSGDRQVCDLPRQSCSVYLDSKLSVHAGLLSNVASQHHGWFSPCNRMFTSWLYGQQCGWQLYHFGVFPNKCEASQVSHLTLQSSCDRPVLAWHPLLASQHIYAFSEGGSSIHIIHGLQNVRIHLWILPGKQCHRTEKVLGLHWSPDGLWLAAITAGYVHTFELAGIL